MNGHPDKSSSRPQVRYRWQFLAGLGIVACTLFAGREAAGEPSQDARHPAATVRSLALRVHHLDRMVDFYREAFGVRFRVVDTFGVASRFGDLDGITLKLVPIREAADFVGFPDVQLGLEVEDVQAVIEIARRYGGRQEGEVGREAGFIHAAVRDPDGNTLELYQRE